MKPNIVSVKTLLFLIFLVAGIGTAGAFIKSNQAESEHLDAARDSEKKVTNPTLTPPVISLSTNDIRNDIPESLSKELLARLAILQDSGTLEGVINEMDEVESRWGTTGGENYGFFFRECLGGALMSSRIIEQNPGVDDLRRKYARMVLKRADSFDLRTEWYLLGYLNNPFQRGELNEVGIEQRRDHVKLWLHAFHRLESEKDVNFDEKDVPLMHVSPPQGINGLKIAGMSSESIKDPKLRAEYESAIEENRKKIQNYNFQHTLRQDEPLIMKDGVRFISEMYAKSPSNMNELSKLLTEANISAKLRKSIEAATQKALSTK